MQYWIFIAGLQFFCTPKNVTAPQADTPSEPPIKRPTEQQIRPAPIDILRSLPKWDDLSAPDTVQDPVEGLGLSADLKRCYKEWFQGDSVHPHVRKYGGRILKEDESTIGRMIECPVERRETFLAAYREDNP